MYILIEVVYYCSCLDTDTGYLLRNKSFICKNCRDLVKAWRWICRKQVASNHCISFSAYFCSLNGISALSSYAMSSDIANPDCIDICHRIYDVAHEIAIYEYLGGVFERQFDDYLSYLF